MLEFKKEYFQTETNRHLYPTTLDLSKAEVYGCKDREAYMYKIPNDYYKANAGNIDFSLYPNGVWSDYTGIKIVERLPFFQPSINFNKLGDITPSNLNKLKEEIRKHIVDLETAITESVNFIDSGVPGQNNLPYLPEGCVWFRDPIIKDVIALPISELYGKFNQMIDELRKILLKLLDKDYNNTLLKFLENVKKELERQLSILAGAGSAFKPKQVANIEILKSVNAKVDEVYEVLGYYRFDDGATHKRKIAREDDGSGVQLNNKLWANIVHNGEVNVSWFGAKGDGVTDDTEAFNKALHCGAYYVTTDNKTFELKKSIALKSIKNLTIDFNGKIHVQSQDSMLYLFSFTECGNICIKNLNFYSENDKKYIHPTFHIELLSSNVRPLSFTNCYDVVIENYNTINANSDLQIRGDVPTIVNGEKIYKSYNFKIINWFSRGSHGNIFSENTKDILIENTDFVLTELEKLGGRTHNIYFAQNTLNAYIKKFKARYIDNFKGSTFHFTNGGLNELDNSSSPKNIVIENADVVCTSNILTGMLNVDVRIYNSKFVASGDSKTLSSVYDDVEFYFENCTIKGFSSCVVGASDKNPFVTFNSCTFNDVEKILWANVKNGHVKVINSVINSSSLINITSESIKSNTKSIVISNSLITIKEPIPVRTICDFKLYNNIINSEDTTNSYIMQNTTANSEGVMIYNNTFNTQQNITKIFNFNPETYPECNIKYGGNLLNGKFDKLEIIGQNSISKLNTLYILEKMKQENVYDDYIAYNDEKFTYDKKQRKLEEQRKLAYEQALQENPNLSYEEFLSMQPTNLNLIEEPQLSETLKKFIEKYL